MHKEITVPNKSIRWLPTAAVLLSGVATAIIYPLTAEEVKAYLFAEIFLLALVPALITLVSSRTQLKIPFSLNAAISLHIILAVHMGTVLDFYHVIPCWDLLMHGYFGFWGAWLVYILFDFCGAGEMHPVGKLLLVFLGVMGLAALWEVGEFAVDLLFGSDAQRVAEALASGANPVQDTMTDIIVAIVGAVVFFAALAVKKLAQRRSDGQEEVAV